MALTNAERQKRHRDRQKEALRNVGSEFRSLPVVLSEWAEQDEMGEHADHVKDAETVANMIAGVVDALEICYVDLVPAELARLLGGAEYVQAVIEYAEAVNAWDRNRKKDKGDRPEPPPIPVT